MKEKGSLIINLLKLRVGLEEDMRMILIIEANPRKEMSGKKLKLSKVGGDVRNEWWEWEVVLRNEY